MPRSASCGVSVLAVLGGLAWGRSEPPSSNAGPAATGFLDTLPRVELAAAPKTTIGASPRADEYVLMSVRWAAISGDSLLIIGDPAARRVAAYGLDGTFRRWIGRVGEGPGEFELPRFGGLTPAGDVWVADYRRVLTYRPSGEVVRTMAMRVPPASVPGLTVLGVDDEGGAWLQEVHRLDRVNNRGRVASGERYRPDVTIRRILGDSSVVVWEGEGDEEVYTVEGLGSGSGSGILEPRLLATLLDGTVLHTRTETSLLRRVPVGGRATPWFDYSAPDVPVGDRYPSIEGPHRYDVLPKALRFIPGADGSTWLAVRHSRHPFDSLPSLLHLGPRGAIEVLDDPARRAPMPLFVGEDHLVTFDVSELEEPMVALYELIR